MGASKDGLIYGHLGCAVSFISEGQALPTLLLRPWVLMASPLFRSMLVDSV